MRERGRARQLRILPVILVPPADRFRDLRSSQVIFTNPLEVAKISAVQSESMRARAHEGEQLEKQVLTKSEGCLEFSNWRDEAVVVENGTVCDGSTTCADRLTGDDEQIA